MEILQDLAKSGKKIILDTKAPKNTASVGKKVVATVAAEKPLDQHQAFVKKCIRDKPSKKEIVEFFERICEAEERKL